jgi:uncharacterized protein (TIGR00251 family)
VHRRYASSAEPIPPHQVRFNANHMIPTNETARGITFAVKVHPRARKNAITGVVGDALKLALTAPPVQGKANQAVIEFFADLFEIPRSSVTIASGETSRNKVVRITGMNRQMVEKRLADMLVSCS